MKQGAQHCPRDRNLRLYWMLASCLLIGLALGLAVYTLACAGRVLPGRMLAGESIVGMTHDEVESFVSQRLSAATVTVRVDGEGITLPLSQAGITIDPSEVATSALSGAGDPLASVESLITVIFPRFVEVPVSIDDSRFLAVAASADELTGTPPVDAQVVLSEDGTAHVTQEGHAGMAIDRDALRSGLVSAAAAMGDYSIDLAASPSLPEVTTQEAQETAAKANALVCEEIALVGPNDTFIADSATKASWVRIDAVGGSLITSIDEGRVRAWVNSIAARVDRSPINGINAVDSQGTVLQLARPAKEGRSVTNADVLAAGILEALHDGGAYSGTIEWDPIEAGMDERLVPSGPERFAYRAGAGEKWVDVNLSDSTLTVYRGQDVVYGPILINHGGVGHETVTGTYRVYAKLSVQDMGCTPEWEYCERNVPWIAYWHEDYALHGAPWVTEFGIGTDESSHGCINIPVEDAHWIHDFVDIGTAVVTHY